MIELRHNRNSPQPYQRISFQLRYRSNQLKNSRPKVTSRDKYHYYDHVAKRPASPLPAPAPTPRKSIAPALDPLEEQITRKTKMSLQVLLIKRCEASLQQQSELLKQRQSELATQTGRVEKLVVIAEGFKDLLVNMEQMNQSLRQQNETMRGQLAARRRKCSNEADLA